MCVEKETAAELARTMRGEEAATEAGEDEGGCGSSLHSTDSHQVTPSLLHQKNKDFKMWKHRHPTQNKPT